MAAETSSVRALARRVKVKSLEKAEEVLNNPGKYSEEVYNQTYLTVLKNSVPRTQEITGEDGEEIKTTVQIIGMKIINDANRVSDKEPETIESR